MLSGTEQAISELKAADGDREKAGWLEWSDVEKQFRRID
jgi:hypothetical protein